MKRAAGFALALAAFACAPDLPRPAAGTTPIAEGTTIIEHAPVPADQRTSHLDWERELVLTGAFGAAFYQPRSIAIGPNGDIVVLDAGNSRVVVFDAAGNELRQFGRAGQGPGEFQSPMAVGISADKIVVYDAFPTRVHVFGVGGEHLNDHTSEERFALGEMVGFEGHLVALNAPGTPLPIRAGSEAPDVGWFVGVFTTDGTEYLRLIEMPDSARGRYLTGIVTGVLPIKAPHPRAAIAPAGLVYATAGDAYEVVAVDSSGSPRWALRVAVASQEVTETHKTRILATLRDSLSEDPLEEILWPERFATLINLEADGAGNLYVFPYALDAYFASDIRREPPPGAVPVDVYSAAGARLFAGVTELARWDAHDAGRVCRIEPDPGTAEEVVACYRRVAEF